MKIDKKGRVVSFSEKPKGEDLKAMVIAIVFLIFEYFDMTGFFSAVL